MVSGYYANWLFIGGYCVSVYWAYKYGQSDYSNFKASGPFKVGYQTFTTGDLENDCSIFYPCLSNTGKLGAPFLVYQEK
jgi:hypothetical protein